MNTVRIVELPDEQATTRLGAELARELLERPGSVVFLVGDLGAGKTTLVRGFLREAGVTGTLRSPTYTLMEPYACRGRSLLHLDLYRLVDPGEVEQLGLADYPPEHGVWLVEWPDRGGGFLPAPDRVVELEYAGAGRRARIRG